MKKSSYWLWVIVILIVIVVFIKILLPKGKNINIDSTQNTILKIEDTIQKKVNQENIIYEIKNIKAITSENNFTAPTFSPDGKNIAFTSLNFKGIYIENIADGTKKKITDDEGSGFRFSWSPDGTAITYLARENVNRKVINTIKIVEIDNLKTHELTMPGLGASMPSFTQSNEVIYSFKGTLVKRKWSNGTVGKEEIIANNVPANIIIPSPKGDKLIIEDNDGIKIMDSGGRGIKVIVKNGKNDFANNAKFSFECNKVLFFNNIETVEHMYVYDINSEKLKDLGEGYFGHWLKDSRIIYCIIVNDGLKNIASDLYIINADGSEKKKVTDTADQIEIQPAILPGSNTIVYRNDKNGGIYQGLLIQKQ